MLTADASEYSSNLQLQAVAEQDHGSATVASSATKLVRGVDKVASAPGDPVPSRNPAITNSAVSETKFVALATPETSAPKHQQDA